MSKSLLSVVFAGGGTGGHLFPAIAVAQSVARKAPRVGIHFIGRPDKLEAKYVPEYGYTFHAIKAAGFVRGSIVKNIAVAFSLVAGTWNAVRIFMKLKPTAAVITGAYISAPAAIAAKVMGSKLFIIETNSYPGLAVRIFDTSAEEIYTAFEETKTYLRKKENIFLTGNPVRAAFSAAEKTEAKKMLGFDPAKPLLFVSGGSLGAAALNKVMVNVLPLLEANGIQCLWQCGPRYVEEYQSYAGGTVMVKAFIDNMNIAMCAADLMIARAGAGTIAEIIECGTCAVLVPSPNVTENHQYFNAKSLADKNAAVLLTEADLEAKLGQLVLSLIRDEDTLKTYTANLRGMRKPNAADAIADRILLASGIPAEAN